MSDRQKYQQHINSALENVLRQVKSPQRASSNPTETAQSSLQPTSIRPAIRRSPIKKVDDVQTPNSDPQAPIIGDTVLELKSVDESSHRLYEAEDLFTPITAEDLSPESDEIPVEEDIYHPPYNLFEEFVETELDILFSRYLDLCRCSQCRADIVALALHQLPAYYVTGTRGTLTAKSVVWTRYMQQVMDAVSKSIHIVYKRPRSNCLRIKQVLWLKPELEEVNSHETGQNELFRDIHQEDVELHFSDEISEIIQTLEQAHDENAAELLPVFSPLVQNIKSANIQKAYQQYQPEELSEQDTPATNIPFVAGELQLLDDDNWDT